MERGFPECVKEATRERRTRNATTISLCKKELLLSFFACELFFFLHSPFDFVREMETDGQKRSSSNFRKVLHTNAHIAYITHLSFQKVRKLRAKVTTLFRTQNIFVNDSRTAFSQVSIRVSHRWFFARDWKRKNFRRLKREEGNILCRHTPTEHPRAFSPVASEFWNISSENVVETFSLRVDLHLNS